MHTGDLDFGNSHFRRADKLTTSSTVKVVKTFFRNSCDLRLVSKFCAGCIERRNTVLLEQRSSLCREDRGRHRYLVRATLFEQPIFVPPLSLKANSSPKVDSRSPCRKTGRLRSPGTLRGLLKRSEQTIRLSRSGGKRTCSRRHFGSISSHIAKYRLNEAARTA